jgi:outer membrane protein TolC
MKTTTRLVLGSWLCVGVVGCATTEVAIPIHRPIPVPITSTHSSAKINSAIQQVRAEEPAAKKSEPTPETTPKTLKTPKPDASLPPLLKSENRPRPAYAQLETLPIDLPTVIRLIDAKSPAVGFAQAKVREAQARLVLAEVQWLPNLSIGTTYNRFDGQTQNQAGNVFGVSRANLFAGGTASLGINTADAIYRPLIERRATTAERYREAAVSANAELEGVNAYLDLVQVHALLEINADTLRRAEEMLTAAKNAREAKLDRTAGDVQRAQIEVLFRRTERFELEGRAGAAAAKLSKLLLLPPNVKLVPSDVAVAPITFIDTNVSLDQLLATALANRPDLAANRESIAAAWARVRRQERGPLLPKLTLANQTGSFGGGLNDDLQKFDARNVLSLQLYWEVKNLGLGNRAEQAERRAGLEQAQFQLLESQARAASDIVEAAQLAAAKYESLDLAEQAVKEAIELYRINKEGILNVVDAKNLFDALRPLQAIQVLNQARQSYLSAVLDFNRAQYRLFTLIGTPTRQAVAQP